MAKANKTKQQPSTATVEVQIEGKNVAVPTDAAMIKMGMTSLSSRIRHLDALGVPTARIRDVVLRSNGQPPIYQHVRNVLKQPLKKGEYAPNASGEARKTVEQG